MRSKKDNSKIKVVNLVRINDKDLEQNEQRNGILLSSFEAYAVGKVVDKGNIKYFVDTFSDNIGKNCGLYYYFDTLLQLQESIESKYVDRDNVFAIKASPISDILSENITSKRKMKKALKMNKMHFNFKNE